MFVVLVSGSFVDQQQWESWGWRIPFLFSLLLLGISLWIRLKLKESPIFQAMKTAGETARNPLKESFSTWARSEEHTSELQSLMRISYAVFCLKKKKYTDRDITRLHRPYIVHIY